jgi:hypothetical protein
MAEQMEDIESRLTAYIDGELAGAEREEIERHLAANLPHMALVQELMRHRQLLRNLPREKSPRDLTEELQGQLEREVLLGGDEPLAEQTRLRIRPWAQIWAAAAILLLVIGLGAVIYKVVPHGTSMVASNFPKPGRAEKDQKKGDVAGTETLSDEHSAIAKDGSSLGGARRPEPVAGKGMGGGGGFGGGGRGYGGFGASGELNRMATKAPAQVVAPHADSAQAAIKEPQAQTGQNTLYITVTANDVASANDAVVHFLDTNKIAWTQGGEDSVRESLALADGMANRDQSFALGAGTIITPSAEGIVAPAPREKSAGADRALALVADASPKTFEQLDKGNGAEGTRFRTDLAEKPAAVRNESAKPKEASEALVQRDEPAARNALAGRNLANESEQVANPEPSVAALARAGAVSEAAGQSGGRLINVDKTALGALSGVERKDMRGVNTEGRVIFARNMNGKQVAELTTALSHPDRGEWAMVRNDAAYYARSEQLAEKLNFGVVAEARGGISSKSEPAAAGVLGGGAQRFAETKSAASAANAPEQPITQPSANLPIQANSPDALQQGIASDKKIEIQEQKQAADEPLVRAGNIVLNAGVQGTDLAKLGNDDNYICVIVLQNGTFPLGRQPSTRPAEAAIMAKQHQAAPVTQPANGK